MTTIYAASAGASARYYTGYLTEQEGELPGRWTGRQAASFGLGLRWSDEPGELDHGSVVQMIAHGAPDPAAITGTAHTRVPIRSHRGAGRHFLSAYSEGLGSDLR